MVMKAHFIGIGGIGMSALARYYKAQNWAVSGSDLATSALTKELVKEGVRVKIGHKTANLPKDAALVVYSQAIKKSNPELVRAQKEGIPVQSYPESIGELTKAYTTVAIAGAHGKSTATAIASLIAIKAKLDPTVIVGTKLKEFKNSNFRAGQSNLFILEADEFGRAFLKYSPSVSLITNIDREHLEVYKNVRGIAAAFLKFIERTEPGGTVILNKDSKRLFALKNRIARIARKRRLETTWYSLRSPIARKIKKIISVPGEHNVSNAVGAYHIGRALRIPERVIVKAISEYHGAWRRMEYRGVLRIKKQESRSKKSRSLIHASKFMIPVYDDYAHHPTEIRASLAAFREKFPQSKIVCVFQPHQTKRLEMLFKEFQSAFNGADSTLVMPIYKVAGRDTRSAKDSEALVRAMQKRYPKKLVFYLKDPKNLRVALDTLLSPVADRHPVLVMMGAGDIDTYTDRLLR